METSPAERPCSSVRATTNITDGPGTTRIASVESANTIRVLGAGIREMTPRGPSSFRRAAARGQPQSALPAGEDPDDDDPDDDEDPESLEEEEDDPDDESFEASLLLEPCLSEPDLAAASFSRLRLAVP